MAYTIKKVTEKNGLQTRAKVLETSQGRFVVLQTYEHLRGEWTPINVGGSDGSRPYQTIAGRLNGEMKEGDGAFSVTPIENRDSGTKLQVERALRADGYKG